MESEAEILVPCASAEEIGFLESQSPIMRTSLGHLSETEEVLRPGSLKFGGTFILN